jgi:hypothetical protein
MAAAEGKKADKKVKEQSALDEGDIKLLQSYVSRCCRCLTRRRVAAVTFFEKRVLQGVGPYTRPIKALEADIIKGMAKVKELIGT